MSSGAQSLLDRQQVRRAQAIPTLTVLAGPVGVGIHLWRTWNARRSVPVVVAGPDADGAAVAWAESAAAQHDLVDAAADRLGRLLGAADWRTRLPRLTAYDLDRLGEAAGLDATRDAGLATCRFLLQQSVEGRAREPRALAQALWDEVIRRDEPAERFLAGVASLLEGERLPALLMVPDVADVERAARLLGAFLAAVPALPAALALSADVAEAVLRQKPETHWQALLREGLVPVQGLDRPALVQRLVAECVDPDPLAASVQKLAADGAPEELAERFADAARHPVPAPTEEAEDQARSAAERFLFERLESLPRTAGLFRLNRRLEFRHGHAAAEADLLAADLKLVIEVDGSYYHLGSPEAYRRDRRKDWLLQRHGYLVLRFLADDVVRRLEDILETTIAAVEARRPPTTP